MKALLGDVQKHKSGLKKQIPVHKDILGNRFIYNEDGDKIPLEKDTFGFVHDMSEDNKLHEVVPHLYISSEIGARNREAILEKEIAAVFNVATEIPNHNADLDIEYKHLDLVDVEKTDLLPFFEEGIQFIDKFVSSERNILVHCQAGVSRSASFCLAYMMKMQGYKYADAIKQIRINRLESRPNDGFVKQLKKLETMLQEDAK